MSHDLTYTAVDTITVSNITNQPAYCDGRIFFVDENAIFQFDSTDHNCVIKQIQFQPMSGNNTIIGITSDIMNKTLYIYGSNGKIRKLNLITNQWSHYPSKLKLEPDTTISDFYGFYVESINIFLFIINGSPFVYNFNTKKTIEYASNWPDLTQVLYSVHLKRLIGIRHGNIYYVEIAESIAKKRLIWKMYNCNILQSEKSVGVLYGYWYLLLFANDKQSQIHCVDLRSGFVAKSPQTYQSLKAWICRYCVLYYGYYRNTKKAVSFGVSTDYGTGSIHLFNTVSKKHAKIKIDMSGKLTFGYIRTLENCLEK